MHIYIINLLIIAYDDINNYFVLWKNEYFEKMIMLIKIKFVIDKIFKTYKNMLLLPNINTDRVDDEY